MNIKNQWDNISEERLIDRLSGGDASYNNVFLPTIKEYLKNVESGNILDFGCGTGELTYEIAKLGFLVTGLDISKHSIDLAKKNFIADNLNFLNSTLKETKLKSYFSIVIANMALMDTQNLLENLKTINESLKSNGRALIIITHPSFWPIYWNYFSDDGFNYLEECAI